ncbi:hypothetical protein COLO4_36160 [Corchorus olitorius]|uniref:Uncharacterized protein n=1 Tax=Corchorus olitorius TaxID=93759 RepID=A0A1R3GAR0_9ROSI|nr:hypothetical protein COLO4_36160 [Corchorus olitorius]
MEIQLPFMGRMLSKKNGFYIIKTGFLQSWGCLSDSLAGFLFQVQWR